MKLRDINIKIPMKFDSLGNPIISEIEREALGLVKVRRPDPRFWYRFECRNCGNIWKARAKPDRAKYCNKCKSLSVKRERLGNGKRGGSHQKKPVSKKTRPPIAQISIHLNNRRKELVEIYNRSAWRSTNLEVDVQ